MIIIIIIVLGIGVKRCPDEVKTRKIRAKNESDQPVVISFLLA